MNWRDYYNTNTPGSSNGYISMFDGYAKNYMDPNSRYNTSLRSQFNRQGQDIASNQHAQGMKMQAAGVNPFANQQYRQASGQAREASMGAYNEAVRNNQQLGAGMLGMGLQARTQMSQQEQQHDAMAKERAQHERGQWLTLGGTLLGGALMGGPGEALGRMIKPEQQQPLINLTASDTGGINITQTPTVVNRKPFGVPNETPESLLSMGLGTGDGSPAIQTGFPQGLSTAITQYRTGNDEFYTNKFTEFLSSGQPFEDWIRTAPGLSRAARNAMRGMYRNYGGGN